MNQEVLMFYYFSTKAYCGYPLLAMPQFLQSNNNIYLIHVCLFVCVEVLRPNGVISSAVSLPNCMFTGQA